MGCPLRGNEKGERLIWLKWGVVKPTTPSARAGGKLQRRHPAAGGAGGLTPVAPLLVEQMAPAYIGAVPTIDLPDDELAAVKADKRARR
jgi:hypothetical protein